MNKAIVIRTVQCWQKNRSAEQNRELRIDPCKQSQLTFDKGARQHDGEMIIFSVRVQRQLKICMQKNEMAMLKYPSVGKDPGILFETKEKYTIKNG